MDSMPRFTIHVSSRYLPERSDPKQQQFAFSYTITITNIGKVAATLRRRRWLITDANGKQVEVEGEGVVGKQPCIEPGEDFTYTSGAMLDTEVGTMQGFYLFHDQEKNEFLAEIEPFRLALPNILH